ncbi:MAG: hypothetical protein RLP02_11295 [Coleofasciculus sp. C2-GNP5-27]
MSIKELIIHEIEQTPEFLLQEVLDFLRFLKLKDKSQILELYQVSESSLQKDWLKPEEDDAWQDL